VYDGRNCVGRLLRRGQAGVEAFSADLKDWAERLPAAETHRAAFRGIDYYVGESVRNFAADATILILLLLHGGSSADEVGHALRRSKNGEPASLIGAAVDLLLEAAAP
jgi:hypothetical protein